MCIRDSREAILRAEGEKKSSILIAEGHKESMILEVLHQLKRLSLDVYKRQVLYIANSRSD